MAVLGYRKDLLVLPFDHRSSFEKGLMGIRGRQAIAKEVVQLSAYKQIIYEGLLEAIKNGVPKESAAILVDQKYGAGLLRDAKKFGIVTCAPVEKSGQKEFDFEYGDDFRKYINEAAPTFTKALVRYNPDADATMNKIQRHRLKVLSDYAHSNGYKFMFELLVPATENQEEEVDHDRQTYDLQLRPELTTRAMAELQNGEVEPDVWKLEGTENFEAARSFVIQAHAGGRNDVGIIILGRGENEERVRKWLSVGAKTDGVIGFAVGRTVFWQPLVDYRDGKISRSEATSRIANSYQRLCKLFIDARK
ncbi:MAG: 2-deoxy-5-keto-D-gluconate 6-phosphate aldolase domain-containing protein [Candidatus Bathyarchaeia archaeon]